MSGLAPRCARPVDGGDRVGRTQPALHREREHPVQEIQVVEHRLRRQLVAALCGHVGGDPVGVDAFERLLAEERDQVAVQHDPVVLDRRRFAFEHVLEVVQVRPPGLVERAASAVGHHDGVLLHPPPQLPLGLRACQPFPGARLAYRAEFALHHPPAGPPAAVVGAVADADRAGAVGARRAVRRRLSPWKYDAAGPWTYPPGSGGGPFGGAAPFCCRVHPTRSIGGIQLAGLEASRSRRADSGSSGQVAGSRRTRRSVVFA